ncbi:MAG: protein kinase, partial [Myxococcales bacterium]|nr:protein kinase [Myxococcales bacterium]
MFFGRYELLRQIGRGGMAEVHVARLGDGAAGKLLALKRLRPSRSSREKVVKRLVSEAQLTVWLHHPNIVQLFDFGRIDGQYYIAMELVDGCDLKQVIHPPGAMPRQLPMEVALDVAAQLADALRYAHRCTDSHGRPLGIIHRDVSPHNVLVSRDGHPKLTDFGVARVMQSSEESMPGLVIGKLAYMPPEQARGEGIDHRVDIYALGATLYEMLTGAKPFDSSSRAEAREARRPAPPSTLRPSVPASLDALVLQAMAPRADERPSDAGELAEALRHELAAHGGAPKRHQLAELVREALDERVRAAFPHTRQLTLRDYTPEEDSLIPRQVTAVRDMALGSVPDAAVTRQRELPRELPREPPAPTREATRAERPAEQRDDDARTGGRALAGWPLLLVLAGVLALGFALGRVSKSRSPVTSHGAGGS